MEDHVDCDCKRAEFDFKNYNGDATNVCFGLKGARTYQARATLS